VGNDLRGLRTARQAWYLLMSISGAMDGDPEPGGLLSYDARHTALFGAAEE